MVKYGHLQVLQNFHDKFYTMFVQMYTRVLIYNLLSVVGHYSWLMIGSACVISHIFHNYHSPWAQRGHRAPPPGSSMSGIILFSGPHWSIIEMLTPYKLGRPHLFGHFSKWPPSKSAENWISHILAFGQPRNTNLVSKPTFWRSLNPIGML